MEILKKYIAAIFITGLVFSCSEEVPETNEDLFSGEWVIEEIFVDIDIPPLLYDTVGPNEINEFAMPDDVIITQVLYSEVDGIFINEFDFTDEVDLAASYSIDLNEDGRYTLENRSYVLDNGLSFDTLFINILELSFQYATPYFIDSYYQDIETYEDLGGGDFEYYLEQYDFQLDYAYFSNSAVGENSLGIWETVGLGEQLLFDYTAPLYKLGDNRWDFEVVDENTIVLSQFGDTKPQLSLFYTEQGESRINGVDDSYEITGFFSGEATIFNASIVLRRK